MMLRQNHIERGGDGAGEVGKDGAVAKAMLVVPKRKLKLLEAMLMKKDLSEFTMLGAL